MRGRKDDGTMVLPYREYEGKRKLSSYYGMKYKY